mmetsp:Transcript_17427/g.44460  ORF Transcript_17427/g.44460 Transcript_17427/m.44460 type:complete len:159 (+) Transcript_17427:1342-1818(+)
MAPKKMLAIEKFSKLNPWFLLRKTSKNNIFDKAGNGKLGSKHFAKQSLSHSMTKASGPEARTYEAARNRRRPVRSVQNAQKKAQHTEMAKLPGAGKLFKAATKKIVPVKYSGSAKLAKITEADKVKFVKKAGSVTSAKASGSAKFSDKPVMKSKATSH